MKIDRLYAITVYLMNHGKTPASELARRFEVSVRTVQRDMDALSRAGIPITAQAGAEGGYDLAGSFRMDRHTATQDEYAFILTALKGFYSAMREPKISAALEKLSALTREKDESVILDFSVLRERGEEVLRLCQSAVRAKRPMQFEYTSAQGAARTHVVEPIAVIYRWYAWYLLAYAVDKADYRTYKLIRMHHAQVLDAAFTKAHDPADKILRENDAKDARPVTRVSVRCKQAARAKAVEYLNGEVTGEYENGDCAMTLHVVESEQLWFGTLLSLGDGVEVLAPEHIKMRLREAARKIITLYGNYDI